MKQNNLPLIDQNSIVQDVLVKMTEGRLGLALVGTKEELKGVITDGDIRRALIDNKNFAELKAKDLMNTNPLTALALREECIETTPLCDIVSQFAQASKVKSFVPAAATVPVTQSPVPSTLTEP